MIWTMREPIGRERWHVRVEGVVQGVGFRPFVYRLAHRLDLSGWVANTGQGVALEVERDRARLEDLVRLLRTDPPTRARVTRVAIDPIARQGARGFAVRQSPLDGARTVMVPPDLATCPECLAELFDPYDRRHQYPFITCTACGPRYSIVIDLPYDRARTVMRRFTMCAACRSEYEDPESRRFHAETNACPECGPQVALWDAGSRLLGQRGQALGAVNMALRDGAIVAVKGLGGFQLMVDARNGAAVERLRDRKGRPEKPLALMVLSLDMASALCCVSGAEASLLTGPEAPIMLLRRRPEAPVASVVAPDSAWLGLMLPTTPLHHLLLRSLDFPVVATSGNVADEPMVTDEAEAITRLGDIADLFLVHDRPIIRPVDDSVVRVVDGRPMLLRRARGYAPAALATPVTERNFLAVGGHQKATVASKVGSAAVLSEHLGDLDTVAARDRHAAVAAELGRMHGVKADAVVCDLHPDYASTRLAEASGLPVIRVQHHVAHAAACMVEHGLYGPVLAVTWDGTGHGPDGSVWGGEFLHVAKDRFRRVAHLRTFRLPGGEAAAREPRRSALGLLFEMLGASCMAREDLQPIASFTAAERQVLRRQLETGLNAPLTSSAGRMFDAIAALVGLRQRASYEGQAAATLEGIAVVRPCGASYPFELLPGRLFGSEADSVVDWEPAVRGLMDDHDRGITVGEMASRFHDGLVAAMVAVARQVGERRVVLSGGCFQNALLTERALAALRRAGFAPYHHEQCRRTMAGSRSARSPGRLGWNEARPADVPCRAGESAKHLRRRRNEGRPGRLRRRLQGNQPCLRARGQGGRPCAGACRLRDSRARRGGGKGRPGRARRFGRAGDRKGRPWGFALRFRDEFRDPATAKRCLDAIGAVSDQTLDTDGDLRRPDPRHRPLRD